MAVDRGSRWHNRRQGTKMVHWLTIVLLLSCISSSILSVSTYLGLKDGYLRVVPLIQQGLQHLRRGQEHLVEFPQHSFDASSVLAAQLEFAAASRDFAQVDSTLRGLPEIISVVPVYGAEFRAALHLVPMAMWLSQAGIVSCDILNVLITSLQNPLKTQGSGLTDVDLALIDADFYQIRLAIEGSIKESRQVQPADVSPDLHVASMLTSFQQHISILQGWLDDIEHILPLLPVLLGVSAPANYLIEILDTTELRPAGGFIGNYGFVTLAGGQLVTSYITDVDLLDEPFYATGKRIPFPREYQWLSYYLSLDSWSFRDSNLDADFPTAARYAELNYAREGGTIPVQGVIAITPAVIQSTLTITGPIDIPEYNETITAQNLIDRIHYYQLGAGRQGSSYVPAPDGYSSQRKHFTALLAEHVMEHLRHLSMQDRARLLQVLFNAVRTKDIQIYLNANPAENLLQRYHLDSSIQPASTDSLFVVDANVSGDKVNSLLVNALDDQISLNEKGDAIHHTTLSYTWATPGLTYGWDLYRSYVRVYVPMHSILNMQSGWSPLGTGTAFGHSIWIGDFTLRCCQTHTITLLWTEPGAATRDANGWHYQYVIQRQAGILRTLRLQLRLPICATNMKTRGGLVRLSNTFAMLTQPLVEDHTIGVDYTC